MLGTFFDHATLPDTITRCCVKDARYRCAAVLLTKPMQLTTLLFKGSR